MSKLVQAVKNFMQEEEGVTAIEYGLIAALIAVMIIAGATTIGVKLDEIFVYIGGQLNAPGSGSGG